MAKIHPGHEVLSLFGAMPGSQALNHKALNPRLVTSLISAFFIILSVSLVLSFSTKALSSVQSAASAANPAQEAGESVAFTPGQFVSDEITKGYLGN